MRSEEFFNILDDMDERLVSEIYEDVQRPQKLAAVPRDRKRLPGLLLSGAACVAVIAAAAVLVRFALPGRTAWLAPASANNSGSDISECSGDACRDWFAKLHFTPYKTVGSVNDPDEKFAYTPEQSCIVNYSRSYKSVEDNKSGTADNSTVIFADSHWSSGDFEIIAADNGTVIFAGKISDEYGSGVIIDHNGMAYTAYGSLDPDSVTVSEGDTIQGGDVFAKPKVFGCGGNSVITILEFKSSASPITEDYFKESCEDGCEFIRFLKNRYDEVVQGPPDSYGMHRITADAGSEIKALADANEVIYTGTDSDGSGMAVVRYNMYIYIVYKGLDTSFPDFTARVPDPIKGEFLPNEISKGETIGYVGDSGDAYWFVLDVHEFEAFAKENNIATHPLDIVGKHE